jgi:hypothetical protein
MTANTFIAPGRRYLQLRGRADRPAGRVTITHTIRDERGSEAVTYRLSQPASAPNPRDLLSA